MPWRANTAAVSIHAPAWGATKLIRRLVHIRQVSIHAPAWGATKIFEVDIGICRIVSIHAPAWGATS